MRSDPFETIKSERCVFQLKESLSHSVNTDSVE